jgi:hypothetical protein
VVLLVASSTCEQCRLHCCCISLQPCPDRPFNAACSALFMFHDDLIDVASSRYPAEVTHELESFG